MKLILPVILIILLLLGCSKQDNHYPYTDYIPNGEGLVRFHFVNIHDTSNYIYWYNTQLPESQHLERFIIYCDSTIEFKIKATKPTMNYLYENDPAQFMVLPNDTIDIIIDRAKDLLLSKMISFKGSTDKISEYLTRGKLLYYNHLLKKELSPEIYNSKIDSLNFLALSMLENFNKKLKLPEWFLEYEKMDIIFHSEYLKQSQYWQRFGIFNQFIENRTSLTKTIIEQEKKINWLTDNTFDYLSTIRPEKYDTLMQPQHFTNDLLFDEIRDNIKFMKGRISDKMMSYFIASKISKVLRGRDCIDASQSEFLEYSKKTDSLFIEMIPLITDTAILKFITEYKTNWYKDFFNQKKLSKGEKAPLFYLEDINGTKVSLSDFKGKLICLNFWATWCGPCIKSIPKKNELVQKYGKSDFVLINILLDYDFKGWKELIAENKFEGIHLKCIGNWEKLLREKYNIVGVPHYVIINKNGNIINNGAKRDSLDFYINSNL